MKIEVSKAIEELKRQFGGSSFTVRDDDQGGAYVIIEPVSLGAKYFPNDTWLGFQIPALYPYADIYPVFIGENIKRADGASFQAPVTSGHSFEGRGAIQISRRNNAAQGGMQKAINKILKILSFMESL